MRCVVVVLCARRRANRLGAAFVLQCRARPSRRRRPESLEIRPLSCRRRKRGSETTPRKQASRQSWKEGVWASCSAIWWGNGECDFPRKNLSTWPPTPFPLPPSSAWAAPGRERSNDAAMHFVKAALTHRPSTEHRTGAATVTGRDAQPWKADRWPRLRGTVPGQPR